MIDDVFWGLIATLLYLVLATIIAIFLMALFVLLFHLGQQLDAWLTSELAKGAIYYV